jgi:transposase, IS5 family
MLRDRYDPVDIFLMVPQLSHSIEPVILQLNDLLNDDAIFQHVKADLSKRYPHTTTTGRPSTPVEVILRMLVIKHLYGWSYAQTEQWVSDSLVLRDFCRIYWQPVPDDTTLIRWALLIQGATLHQLLDHVVELACQLKVTRGRKLRIDGTVVETNIHAPTDSSLLCDGVRVISRILGSARECLGECLVVTTHRANKLFRDRSRSAKRLAKQIIDRVRSRGEGAAELRKGSYERLLEIGEAILCQAKAVDKLLSEQAHDKAGRLVRQLGQFVPRMRAVVEQTRRRVLQGERVPASEKLVSIFEPQTAIIRKGKLSKPTEYGRMVWLDEVEGGIISRYQVLVGNPADSEQVQPSLEHHKEVFKRAPKLLAADRGCFSEDNEEAAEAGGVEQICLPKPGARSEERKAHERQRWFVRGRNWRAGIEGRIHGLKKRQKLDRCLNHGDAGMERWVGWGVISHDLWRIAQAQVQTTTQTA